MTQKWNTPIIKHNFWAFSIILLFYFSLLYDPIEFTLTYALIVFSSECMH